MPDYQLGKLYIITSEQHKLLYVGSTAQKYISTRITGHIADYKNGSKKCCSYKVLDCDDYNYKLLKDFPCSNKQQLKREEGFWILHYKEQPDYECVNKNIAGRTPKEWEEANKDKRKEWYDNNRDKKKEYDKIYKKNNKDKAKEQNKEWYQKNQDKRKEQMKEYYENNKDKIKERMREYRKSKTP